MESSMQRYILFQRNLKNILPDNVSMVSHSKEMMESFFVMIDYLQQSGGNLDNICDKFIKKVGFWPIRCNNNILVSERLCYLYHIKWYIEKKFNLEHNNQQCYTVPKTKLWNTFKIYIGYFAKLGQIYNNIQFKRILEPIDISYLNNMVSREMRELGFKIDINSKNLYGIEIPTYSTFRERR
jgi:hypothetical protein